MLDQHDVEIGGERFVVGKMSTSDALRFGVILGRIFGSVMAGGLDRGVDLGDDPEEPEEDDVTIDLAEQMNIGKMIEGLMVHMDERKVPALIQELVQKSVALPKFSPEWYDTRFAGKLDQLLDLLTVIFEDNFGGAIETARKKFEGFGLTTSPKFSDHSTGGNGLDPTPEKESPASFFDQSEPDTAP